MCVFALGLADVASSAAVVSPFKYFIRHALSFHVIIKYYQGRFLSLLLNWLKVFCCECSCYAAFPIRAADASDVSDVDEIVTSSNKAVQYFGMCHVINYLVMLVGKRQSFVVDKVSSVSYCVFMKH